MYKERKQVLSQLTAENGALHRTVEVLRGKVDKMKIALGDRAKDLDAKVGPCADFSSNLATLLHAPCRRRQPVAMIMLAR